jgi:adenosine deaminase
LIISPFHAELNQIPYENMLEGLINGIDQAYRDFGIEARLLMAFIRQQGPGAAMHYADQVLHNQHPYVVGINLVGDIKQYEIKVFDKLFDRARAAQLGLSCHAGEIDGGPEEIWQAIDILGVDRISHGVRCVEDPQLMDYLFQKKIMLEVCPTSNVILKMYADYSAHPLQKLKEAGLLLCLNTDDPGFFQVNLTHEYEIAKTFCGFSAQDLCGCTEQALYAGFMDQATRERCLIEFRKRSPYNSL